MMKDDVSFFYCYSYKLMLFLKLNDVNYCRRYNHRSGKLCWVYHHNPQLTTALDSWNQYKFIFSTND